MNCVATEVAQKVGVLLKNQDLDSSPRQQVPQHHPRWAAAHDTTAAP
jgi:hypothetical protein